MEFKDLFPREHGLWGWVGVPLFGAMVAAPSATAALAAVSVFAGFGAVNAYGRYCRGSAKAFEVLAPALGVAVGCGTAAWLVSTRPLPLLVSLGALAAGGFLFTRAVRGQMPHNPLFEFGAIGALVATGACVSAAAGASIDRIVASGVAIASWLTLGLWWVNWQMSAVIPGRRPWLWGPLVALATVICSLLTGVRWGHPWVGILPALYALRMLLHPAATSARDAKRTGLTELGWGLGVTVLAASL